MWAASIPQQKMASIAFTLLGQTLVHPGALTMLMVGSKKASKEPGNYKPLKHFNVTSLQKELRV